MTRVFATIRAGVMHYLEELTIHVSLRAPWQTIIRNLFHDAVKLGSLIRLRQLDYRVDGPGAGDDDLVADICKHCPDLRMIRFAPSHLWHRNSQAKSDVVAMLTQPCWPRLEQIHLESYASITDFPYAQPEALAKALNKTRFPSLASMAVTLQGSMNADQFIWDVLSNPHATVMPRVRELRFATVPRPRPSRQQVQSSTVWSQDSYRNLPTTPGAADQPRQHQHQHQHHHHGYNESPTPTSEENLEDLTTAALEALKKLRLSSLQSVHLPHELDTSFSCTYTAKDILDRLDARLKQALS